MSLYVASSWKNEEYPTVVNELRRAGFYDLYDFRNPGFGSGFSWREVSDKPKPWDAETLTVAHSHPRSQEAFENDKRGIDGARACVLVLPCGKSAHLEAGYIAHDRPLVVYMPKPDEPELMYKLARKMLIVDRLDFIAPALAHLGVRP